MQTRLLKMLGAPVFFGGVCHQGQGAMSPGGCLAPLPPPWSQETLEATFLSSLNFPVCRVGVFTLHSGGLCEMRPRGEQSEVKSLWSPRLLRMLTHQRGDPAAAGEGGPWAARPLLRPVQSCPHSHFQDTWAPPPAGQAWFPRAAYPSSGHPS